MYCEVINKQDLCKLFDCSGIQVGYAICMLSSVFFFFLGNGKLYWRAIGFGNEVPKLKHFAAGSMPALTF